MLVVLDLDCKPSVPSVAFAARAAATVRSHARWDVLTANSIPYYYDHYALRSSSLGLWHSCVPRGDCGECNRVRARDVPPVPAAAWRAHSHSAITGRGERQPP